MTVLTGTHHWLAQFAYRAGCDGAAVLDLAPDAAPADAWDAVARAWGITHEELARRVAEHFRVPVAKLEDADRRVQSLIPESLARRHLLFPLRATDRELTVATWNPHDIEAEQMIAFSAARTPVFEVMAPRAIQESIDARYSPDGAVQSLLDRVGVEVPDDVLMLDEKDEKPVDVAGLDGTPVVKLTAMILTDAVRQGASDIHLQPGSDGGAVRFRVDGLLRTYMQIPMPALNRVVSRIKVLGRLNIADRLRPQDGRTRAIIDSRTFDLRISTVPARDSENAVIRVLDPNASRRLDDLGILEADLKRFRRVLGHRDGIVVVTGPTGSGKTTSLYAALREVANGEVNIMTVEDPVEYELPGITQIQADPRRGVTFENALRSILRQDPDVIFIGEIRDLATAEVAVQAALTGHLVLSTIHANDAVGTIGRLTDLGLDRAKIFSTLRGSVAQRLLRRVCRSCAVGIDGLKLTAEEQRLAERHGVVPVVRAVGCPECGQTGYRGRLPVLETLLSGNWLESHMAGRSSTSELQAAAVASGMRTLRESALERVRAGECTLEEVDRVLGGDHEESAPADPATSHILLVDDDGVTRAIARKVLEKHGYRVSEAGDGIAALEKLRSTGDIKLLVLDLDMPRLGGAEVLDQVRKSVATAGLPVIVLTGSNNGAAEIELLDRGADDFVRKPIDAARFVTRVRAALRRAGG